MYYLVTLFVLLALYAFLIVRMEKFRNRKLTNALFIALILGCYLCLVLYVYLDVGLEDWNFKNVLPTANVSPFMFSSLLVYIFLPQKGKRVCGTLICALSLGMLLSFILACVGRAADHYAFHFHFLLDYVAHFSLSLFGIYLAKSGQVIPDRKNVSRCGSLIVIAAAVMFLLNLIFGTSFFGLARNDGYAVYNMKLAPNWYLSALLYFSGLIGVLFGGYLYVNLLCRKKRNV